MRSRFDRSFRVAAWLALGMASAVAGFAQEVPADPVLQGFEPSGDFELYLDGKAVGGAELFRSQRAGSALLILTRELPGPVLVAPRQREVSSLDSAKVVRRADGSLDVLADASLQPQGSFTVEGSEVRFAVGARQVRLAERPHLLGRQDTRSMLGYSPEYVYRARQYQPSEPMLRALKQVSQPVTVKVYFGSWCPFCKENVPRLLRVAEELEGSKVGFEYYGLPTPFGNEPEAKKAGINGVPTAVIYRGGKEIGRLQGADWRIPELALRKMITQG
jgi:thiol-disulfide isomerase/thioredoxin